MADGITIARGLLGAAQVGDGPTPEQTALVQSLMHGYFGLDADAASLSPLSASEFAAAVETADTKRVVDLLVVLEFCRHSDGEAQAQRAEDYARALGADEPFLIVARDALTEGHERVMADWTRFREASSEEPGLPATDAELAAQLRSLRECPIDSLGRAYFDFLDAQGIAFPGEEGGGDSSLVAHDFSPVLAGYNTDGPSELALQAMLTSATGFDHHFSGLVASLALYESGKFDILDLVGKLGSLARPGGERGTRRSLPSRRRVYVRLLGHRSPGAGRRSDMTTNPPPFSSAPPPIDPAAMLRSRNFVALLVFAAIVGVFVSLASWGFLDLVHQIQLAVFSDLPDALGFDTVPTWWPIPVLVLAGLPVAFAIVKLPGNGGHVPAHGLQMGTTEPNMVPGVALAALATLGLGLVLGPEAPLIAIGGGLAIFAVKLAKRDAPPQLLMVLAAGSFAAISVIFGAPIVAAVLVIEAGGLVGATLPLILIPGLIAAGIGSLVFIGMANWTALSTSAYSLQPLALPYFAHVTWEEIGWTIAPRVRGGGRHVRHPPGRAAGRVDRAEEPVAADPRRRPHGRVVGDPVRGDDHPRDEPGALLRPGRVAGARRQRRDVVGGCSRRAHHHQGSRLGGVSRQFRGGPTFPAIFLGAAGGIAASHLPGLSITPAVAVGMGVMVVAFLQLPLSAVVIATALTTSAGLAVGPSSSWAWWSPTSPRSGSRDAGPRTRRQPRRPRAPEPEVWP